MKVPVRQAGASDVDELARMRQLSRSCPAEPWATPRNLPDGPWVTECREAFASLLSGPNTFAASVVDAAPGHLATGAVRLPVPRLPGPDSGKPFNGEIVAAATGPGFRHRGYSRATVNALMGWMVAQQCLRISLTSSFEGEPLYVSLGFVNAPRMIWRAG
ncbi:GNAT family N-acetyltransferase [Streptomyces noursei]|uniref:GNAT family N-acetyltransferase n=1 Tax=Streptomyces noursei TaxID=1971 RepID=UPI00167803BE|nr:GNAT family N-acetyltransferase [Streptomyces noursei]MCZ1019789.1 GNAT family N-acetyltransferase [Streptomyces noursei]GGX36617.1 hypothetical protein GCM10010341_67790 [Streptomyces noursei]